MSPRDRERLLRQAAADLLRAAATLVRALVPEPADEPAPPPDAARAQADADAEERRERIEDMLRRFGRGPRWGADAW